MKFEKRLSRKILDVAREDTQETEDNSKMTCPPQIMFGDHVKGEMDKGCDKCGEKRNAHTVFLDNPKENLPLGRRGCRQENNIKTDNWQKSWKAWTEFIWLGKGTRIRLSKKFLKIWFP